MTDIAQLGISITTNAAKAATDLTALANAAKPAAAAASNLEKASNDTAKAHAGMSTQAMAAQHSIRSLLEALASGQPITQAFGQQLNHLSYAATGSGGLTGAFKQATGALLGLLSPATLLIGGIAAIGGGFLYALHSIAETGKAFDDTARSAGTTTDSLHALANAASFKGIDNAEFLKGMDKFGASVYEAQHNMGGLAETFRANGKSAKDFNDYLAKAADLIAGASSNREKQNLLTQMGLPATQEWVRFLSQGADGIKRATDEATKFGDTAESALVAKAREFDEAWSKTLTNFSNNFKNAILSGKGYLDDFGGTVNSWLAKIGVDVGKNVLTDAMRGGPTSGSKLSATSNVDQFYAGTGAGLGTAAQPKPTVDPNVLKNQISLEQQHIGLLGQTATAADAVRQVELSVSAARLNGVAITDAQVSKLKELAAQQTLGITAIRASTDAQNTEAQTVGMSTGAAAAYAAAQNAINDAKRAGRTLTPQNIADINAEANALGAAAQNADNLKWSYTNLVNGPLQAFSSAIAQGATAMDALKKAGQSALNSIASKLADIASQNLWKAAFGGSSGGGGIFSSLFGGGSGSTAVMSSGLGAGTGGLSFPMFASGTPSAPGGWSIVGEHGPELMNVPKGAQILPNGTAPGGGTSVVIQQYNTFTGNDPGTEARMRQAIAQSKDAAVQAAVQAVATIKGTSPGYLRAAR